MEEVRDGFVSQSVSDYCTDLPQNRYEPLATYGRENTYNEWAKARGETVIDRTHTRFSETSQRPLWRSKLFIAGDV